MEWTRNKASIILAAMLAALIMLTPPALGDAEAEEGPKRTRALSLTATIVPSYNVAENLLHVTNAIDTTPEMKTVVNDAIVFDDEVAEAEFVAPATEPEPVIAPIVAVSYETTNDASMSSTWFKKMGVHDEAGWHYTWYSSNARRHKNTDSWVLGEDLIYRTQDGYVVVACVADANGNRVSQGELVPTPFGTGKVCDSGCAAGTIDIYVGF